METPGGRPEIYLGAFSSTILSPCLRTSAQRLKHDTVLIAISFFSPSDPSASSSQELGWQLAPQPDLWLLPLKRQWPTNDATVSAFLPPLENRYGNTKAIDLDGIEQVREPHTGAGTEWM